MIRAVTMRRRQRGTGLMNVRTIARQVITAGLLSSFLLSSPAAAIEPEKQPIYVNIEPGSGLCGTPNGACTVPAGQRLVIEHVSGFVIIRNAPDTQTATEVTLTVGDPQLGLNFGNAFHKFIAIRGSTTSGPNGDDTAFTFSTPFKMMLNPGATFQFSGSVAVSGYLVKN
jgi:hypothetical protein